LLDEKNRHLTFLGIDGKRFIPLNTEITNRTDIAGGTAKRPFRDVNSKRDKYNVPSDYLIKRAGKIDTKTHVIDVHWVDDTRNNRKYEMKVKKANIRIK